LIQEGNVGGETGMITFGFKAGTETSSRFIESLNYTIGVLVQSNFWTKERTDSSGDIFLVFSTANILNTSSTMRSTEFLFNDQMNLLFEVTIQCVEEAVINAMIAAETMIGHNGLRVEAISHENLIEILKKYNRLNDT